MRALVQRSQDDLVGRGLYGLDEAALLIGVPAATLRRWLVGHRRSRDGTEVVDPPLWRPELPRSDDRIVLSFSDLAEARVVDRLRRAGLGLRTIRDALRRAREVTGQERPLATERFRTDGRTIFLESLPPGSEPHLLDLCRGQYAFHRVVAPALKDLDFEAGVARRWWPLGHGTRIVVDPHRALGQPIDAATGVHAWVLAEEVANGNDERAVAKLYDVAPATVRQACAVYKVERNAA